MNIYSIFALKMNTRARPWNNRSDLQMVSFYSLREHPLRKQVHLAALITILCAAVVVIRNFILIGCKEKTTHSDITTLQQRHAAD
ncbi:hypothetical protein QL189_16185 [Cronobacter turicensis]|uniref:hypothetical protein n=1 Tax=Cronobacter TaxID=413496 RepID=UPI000CFDAFDF|nr:MULTISPECIES: hypothetical protein [Cronobacter]EGT4494134.1 hypothetical protein [Cronobacter turicensis]EKM0437037.1 hypothetical protein [Cronobacter turicensis]ELQ6220757.1 hypothetical protein [Cronobacter turicensis]ELY3541859.1 hypothetical protein [Cronobacter turicensis]ELY3625470.1 hypothetical protein [Cronobacter turicensis]